MPALNFLKQFADDVESGKKRQTIRAFRKDGRDPTPGRTLYHYTGMRSKACRLLGVYVCRDTTSLKITEHGDVLISGNPIAEYVVKNLAENDGFDDVEGFLNFFDKTHGLPFNGLLIEW